MGEHSEIKVNMDVANNGPEQGTTKFLATSEAAPYDRHSSPTDPQNDMDLEIDDIKDIADFLAKPVAVASGTYTTANVAQDLLFSGDIYTLLSAQTIWLQKLQGFLNIRGDVKLRLVINSTPFQAGIIRMSYIPCANQIPREASMHLYNLQTISQLPGSYLNLNDSFVEVTVPYLAPTSFYERDSSNQCSWGNVYIHAFTPMRTATGASSVNFTLWMSVENLELSGQVVPQSNTVKKRRGRGTPQDSEQNSGKGPIAKIMSSGVQLANDIAAIPSLAPLAVPTSWALGALGAAAEYLGWSKPTLTEGPCVAVLNNHAFNVNVDGNDTCAPLSLRADNKITTITDAAPGELDEMSFNFIKSRWAYFQTTTWSTAAASQSSLLDLPIYANGFGFNNTVAGKTISTSPPATILARYYGAWRGSFEVRIRIVKTGFHTGTLMFGWLPGQGTNPITFADTAYLYREIVDIQEGGEYVYNLPYLIPQDYLDKRTPSGRFFAYIVNPLLAPSTVSGTVDVMLEVRGGPDLTYVIPIGSNAVPVVPQSNNKELPGTSNNKGEASVVTLASKDHKMDSVHHAMLAIGEQQQSILELLKAQYSLRFAADWSGVAGAFKLAVNRFYGARYNGVSYTTAELGGDPLSLLGSMYLFSRGATRYRIQVASMTANPTPMRGILIPGTYNDGASAAATFASGITTGETWAQLVTGFGTPGQKNDRVYSIPSTQGGLAIQAPFYSQYRYTLNRIFVEPGAGSATFTTNQCVGFTLGNSSNGLLSRSVGDDYSLSYFLGTVPWNTDGNLFPSVS